MRAQHHSPRVTGLRPFRLLLATAALLIVALAVGSRGASRAAGGGAASAQTASAVDPTGRFERLRAAYAAAIELMTSGDAERGREELAAVSAGLREELAVCVTSPDCDVTRYVDVFEAVLHEQLEARTGAAPAADMNAALPEDPLPEPDVPAAHSPVVTAVPALGRTVSLLRGTDLAEIITLNDPVKAALDDWLTWMRPRLMESYENYQFLRDRIAPIYEEAGLPEALLFAMVATETHGRVHSFSRAGAAGLLQFMRYTGRRYGLGDDDGFDLRLDPVAATRANVAYLDEQFAALNDDLELVLAAYNGGENRVRRLHRQSNGAGLWDRRVFYALPRETREYVPRILAAAWLFLHPEDYNLEWPSYRTATASLTLKRDASLDELTICLGQVGNPYNGWFRTLRNLNPRVSPGDILPAGATIELPASLLPVYQERCLSGDLLARARELHEANYPDGSALVPYVVQRGDTLGRIASRLSCTTTVEIAALNDLRPPRYLIRVGQQLNVPDCG